MLLHFDPSWCPNKPSSLATTLHGAAPWCWTVGSCSKLCANVLDDGTPLIGEGWDTQSAHWGCLCRDTVGVLNYALRVSQKLVVSRDFRFQVLPHAPGLESPCLCSLPGCTPEHACLVHGSAKSSR